MQLPDQQQSQHSQTDPAHLAWFQSAYSDQRVRCGLCAHHCLIAAGKRGICQVRENRGGMLYTRVFGRTISQHVDPIEKKPLFHFFPGSTAFSIATPGCNFQCQWCQNWQISQMPREQDILGGREATAEQIVAAAQASGSRSIAYTYTEPTIFYEYAYAIAGLAQKAGIANVFVTNGYLSADAIDCIESRVDAANVDLKAFQNKTYQRYVGARLQPVLDGLKRMYAAGIWLEVTTLIIPDLNDDPQELRSIAQFIAQELSPDVPWHISRFFPAYQMSDRPPTPLGALRQAFEIGREAGLHYIYMGNVRGVGGEDTRCPSCNATLIQRSGYRIIHNRIQQGKCPACGTTIAGIGMGDQE